MGFSLRYFPYQNIFTEKLREVNGSVKDLVSVNLMVASMGDYAVINSEYVRRFGVNPPVRVCVQGPISNKVNTVPAGFCDHPPSEGLRSLKPARPLQQGSGYSDRVVAKARVF